MRKLALFLISSLTLPALAWAQPSNDDCTNPIVIQSVLNFCSAAGAYTNAGATPSTYSPGTCFGSTQSDVWFAFTPQATDVTITVRGATGQAPGGTLQDPQVSLYYGTCGGTINELGCEASTGNNNIAELYEGGLFVGFPYLIRIQGAAGQTGTFQICINNYNPPVTPTSDCPQSSILCDKSPFVVQSVTGAGANNLEMEDAACFFNGVPGVKESNSTWFVWTCSQAGTLEFTLTPLNGPDDLDFVVYRLPNGIGNCSGKVIERCMASGGTSNPNINPAPCLGKTGLRAGDPDISEDAGCEDPGDDAWLSPLNMVAGQTYALVINNFSLAGNGFSVEFGGTGKFLGPEADFTTIPDAVCLGTPVEVLDASTFPIGSITAWKWSFGADAMPQTATGPGPHTVAFNHPGQNLIVLTIETDLGCKVTKILNATIFPDVEVDTLIAAPDCNGTTNGKITINNITSGTPPYQYSWNNGPLTSENFLDSLGVGTYTLLIRDANNCETDLSIQVDERVLTADAVVTKPLCTGDNNGMITLNITNGKAPILFNWGNGNVPNNVQGGFAAGVYTVSAVDDVLCEGIFNVTVTDNPALDLVIDTTDISCFGANDGSALADASGGVGNFAYQWQPGSQATSVAENLPPGQYNVTVTDGNGCTITGGVFITEPADVGVNLLGVLDLLCNGLPTGEINVEGVGGRPDFTFSADGVNFQAANLLTGLAAGDYWIKVKDSAGCIDSVFATINQPPPLIVDAVPADTLLDLGFTVDISTVTAPAGRPVTFEWTPPLGLSDVTVAEPTATAISNQLYVVKITDEDGCMAFDTVSIRVNKQRPIYFPNVFAPDKPYPNDHFTGFSGPAAEQFTLLRIYDRWGELIFEKEDFPLNEPNFGWDGLYKGEEVMGVFTWYAMVRFVDQQEFEYEGSVTVVR
ncbi:MAG TPA: gliding motility-associated C-terminal domain-containing protein [Saprospiraceae bacterium]|nr:gliding motility-associated C-terminal domain-containing protein [Saprospiraceae bacterium]